MFLSLGGSRRRAGGNAQLQQGSSSLANNLLLQDLQSQGLVSRSGLEEDALQALATGKYASARTAALPSTCLIRSKSFGEDSSPFVAGCNYSSSEPVQVSFGTCSPKSTLSYNFVPSPTLPSLSRATSRVSSDSGNVSLHGGGEEAISRDCTSRRSQALDLAKKLKNSLGSKFADSLRETIKEVAMKQERVSEGKKFDNAWPALVQSLEEENNATVVSQSGKPWDGCWSVETKNDDIADHSSLLSFEGLATLDAPERSESSLSKRSFGGSAEHSKRLSWFSQENLSQSAIAELSWGTEFFPSGHSDMSLCAVLKESGAKESWTGRSTMSQLSSSVTRRHVFPEAGAMGTCRPNSLLQQSNPNFRPRGETGSKPSVGSSYNLTKKANAVDQSFLDMSKGFQSSDKDNCESLLEFLNPGHPSNREDYARQRLYAKSAKVSCESWHETASTSYNNGAQAVLEIPECGALGIDQPSSGEKGVTKRSREDAYAGVQLSKRQCTGSLLDVTPPAIDEDGEVKSDPIAGGFEEYLANLTASARVPSYELSGSPLANLLEDFSQDSLVPIHLT